MEIEQAAAHENLAVTQSETQSAQVKLGEFEEDAAVAKRHYDKLVDKAHQLENKVDAARADLIRTRSEVQSAQEERASSQVATSAVCFMSCVVFVICVHDLHVFYLELGCQESAGWGPRGGSQGAEVFSHGTFT